MRATAPAAGRAAPPTFENTAGLPGALLDPAAYPFRPESVELRETHISWVFLAGETAYKVKKPVRLPFVDYGTLERRRACCNAELRLNRRFSSAVYRRVVALVPRGPDGLAVASAHDPRAVEYAVAMACYDESATLAAHLADGRAVEADLVAVGAAIAGFHAAAPVQPGDSAKRLAAVVEETLTTLAAAGAPARRLAHLARFCRAALAAFGPELADRATAGLVRDGHGDLRAEHVLLGSDIQAVDGVEFDPDLRVADVGYDLAFLIMDVARRDDDLARALLRGYRAAGGDPGGEGLLAFLCAVRALIRAKVDFLRAAQLTGAAADKRTARAIELFTVAERFAWRARLPCVVCVTGRPPAASRRSLRRSAAAAGRTVLSSDRIRKLRAGIEPYERAAPSAYGDGESRAVYTELARRATAAARRDGGAIVDATFRRATDADAFAATSPAAAAAAWLVCEAPPAVLAGPRAGAPVPQIGLRRRTGGRRPRARHVPRPVPGAGAAAGPARHDAVDRRVARTPGEHARRAAAGKRCLFPAAARRPRSARRLARPARRRGSTAVRAHQCDGRRGRCRVRGARHRCARRPRP